MIKVDLVVLGIDIPTMTAPELSFKFLVGR